MHLEQIATGLGQAGADPATIDTVTKMADVTRKLVSALGAGSPAGDNPGPNPSGAAPPTGAPPPAPAGGHTIASATDSLHKDLQTAAAARQA